jgi:CRP-like cAMP-binding protein
VSYKIVNMKRRFTNAPSLRTQLLREAINCKDPNLYDLIRDYVTYIDRILPSWLGAEQKVQAWVEHHPNRREPHRIIAEETGLSRETVSRIISKMKRDKLDGTLS